LKVTVLVPWVAPKLLPLMVTRAVGGAEFGDTLEIVGALATVKATGLLVAPPTVTTRLPVVAPVVAPAL